MCEIKLRIFQEIEDARVAIRESKGMIIDGRPVRAEHANADRKYHLLPLAWLPF